MSVNDIVSTYNRLIEELQRELYSTAIKRTATAIELADGRRAWVVMEITTEDPEEEAMA